MNPFDFLIENLYLKRKFATWGKGSKISFPASISGSEHIHFGSNCVVGKNSVLTSINHDLVKPITNSQIKVGNNVYIGHNVNIHSMGLLSIGNGCVLSDYVYISNVSHGFNPDNGLIMQQQLEYKGAIELRDNTFIGFNAKILPNIILEEWCIVGSGSVVTKSFPKYSIIAGNPARLVRKYNTHTKSWDKI